MANSYTAPLEKDLKIDANGTRAFMGHFLCGTETVKRFVNVDTLANLFQPMRSKTICWQNYRTTY